MPRQILGINMYSTKEIAGLLGISTNTVYKYAREEKLKVVKISGRFYASEDNIKDFLQCIR